MDVTEGYRLLELSQGQFAKVSTHRYEHLNQWKWCAWWSKSNQSFYAVRETPRREGKKRVYLHRYILGLVEGDGVKGDHWDGDTLNDTDSNLRPSTHAQNAANSRTPRTNTSGLKGAHFNKAKGLWEARIRHEGKRHFLGYFHTPAEAHRAYCEGANRLHGEFARTA